MSYLVSRCLECRVISWSPETPEEKYPGISPKSANKAALKMVRATIRDETYKPKGYPLDYIAWCGCCRGFSIFFCLPDLSDL